MVITMTQNIFMLVSIIRQMANDGPIALFVANLDPKITTEKILELDGCSEKSDGSGFFVWNLETKYYSCVVRIMVCNDISGIDPDYFTSIETVCLLTTGREDLDEKAFDQVRAWSKGIDDYLSEVSVKLLLLCGDGANSESVRESSSPSSVLNWCIENDFEMVEMERQTNDGDDDDDDDDRCYGMVRVKEALACASWSNMQLKAEKSSTRAASSLLAACSREATGSDGQDDTNHSKRGKSESKKESFIDELLGFEDEGKLLEAVNANDDDDEASFDMLFQQLAKFREKADSMPHEERKAFAEKVTLKFWNAIKGDDSEIEGLDDED